MINFNDKIGIGAHAIPEHDNETNGVLDAKQGFFMHVKDSGSLGGENCERWHAKAVERPSVKMRPRILLYSSRCRGLFIYVVLIVITGYCGRIYRVFLVFSISSSWLNSSVSS